MKKSRIFILVLVLLLTVLVSAENLALNKKYLVNLPAEASYPDSGVELTDGKKATASIYNAGWAGYLRQDYRIFIVDLGATYEINDITISPLQDVVTGVHLPKWTCFSTSTDGRRWKAIDVVELDEMDLPNGIVRYTIASRSNNAKARYVALKLEVGTWLFVDEITVEGNLDTKEDITISCTLEEIDFKEIEFDY
ncbi:MAG: discoidin domain-containing protein [Firmicutes bacterium]|nr:discoidin domain-containing protein [Bacillota bacterium]